MFDVIFLMTMLLSLSTGEGMNPSNIIISEVNAISKTYVYINLTVANRVGSGRAKMAAAAVAHLSFTRGSVKGCLNDFLEGLALTVQK